MYAAVLEVHGMYRDKRIYKGRGLGEIISKFNKVQDLSCLYNMARSMGTDNDAEEAKKLGTLLDKWGRRKLTIDDLKDFEVNLSIGSIRCYDVLEGDDAYDILKERYPDAD